MKKPPISRFKTAAFVAICAVAFTSLNRGDANPDFDFLLREDAEFEADLGENYFRESSEALEKANATMDADAFEALLKSVPYQFVYTPEGGLRANNKHCETFIAPDGTYGARGEIIRTYLAKKWAANASTPMLADDLVGMIKSPAICPNWREFDTDLRIKFWTWTFTAMAAMESACGYLAYKGVEGSSKGKIAIGLLQMEKQKKYRRWREQEVCKNASEKEIATDRVNLQCGIDIMEWQIAGAGARKPLPIYTIKGWNGKSMLQQSYWEKLNKPKGGDIGRLVRAFKPCYDKKLIPKPPASPHGPFREEYIFPEKFTNPNYQANSDQEQLELEYLFEAQSRYVMKR